MAVGVKFGRLMMFLLILLLLTIFSIIYPNLQESTSKAIETSPKLEKAILTRVIDGDTIELNNSESIRLLGINTPEKNMPLADASKEFLKQFVGAEIYLLSDKTDLDKYNRELRYIFYEERLLNLEILEKGFANAYYTDGLKYEKQLLNAEAQARELELGIWQKSQDKCSSCINLRELNYKEEFFIIENICSFDCSLEKWFIKDTGRNTIYLKPLLSNQQQQYNSSKEIWNNQGDNLFIFDSKGLLVLYYSY